MQSQYYVVFDGQGNIDGFYDTALSAAIPEGALPISPEQWETYAAAPHRYKLDGDTIREKTPEEIEVERAQRTPAPPSLQQRIEAAEQALRALLEVL